MYTWIMVNQLFFQFKKKQLNSIEQKKKKRKLTDIRLFKKELSNWNTDRWMLDLGNPLQCSCLENPRDGGVGWAAVYGVAQSRTWLKWLSSSSSNSACKESACNAGDKADLGLIPGLRRSPGGENGNALQYSCLKHPMGWKAWQVVQNIAESWTVLSMNLMECWV